MGKTTKKKRGGGISDTISDNRGSGPDVLGIARKQRHAELLRRVRDGTALSKKELAELGDYEKQTSTESEASPEILRTRAEAARYAAVSEKTITRWKQGKGPGGTPMPVTAEGHYLKSILDMWKGLSDGVSAVSSDKQRDQKAIADLRELRVKELERRLADMEAETERELTRRLTERARWMSDAVKADIRQTAAKYPKEIRGRIVRDFSGCFGRILAEYGGKK